MPGRTEQPPVYQRLRVLYGGEKPDGEGTALSVVVGLRYRVEVGVVAVEGRAEAVDGAVG